MRCRPTVGLAGAADVDAAVAAAGSARRRVARDAGRERAAILFRLADLLDAAAEEAALIGALDNGTPVGVMRPGHVHRALGALLRRLVRQARRRDVERRRAGLAYVRLEPYGVVAAIPPWNGSMMGMGQKVAPALAAGNAVVAKAPELAPFGMLRFAELALEAGLPPGVLNVVVGDAVAGRALVRSSGHREDQLHRRRRRPLARSWPPRPRTSRRSRWSSAASRPTSCFPTPTSTRRRRCRRCSATALLSGQGCALPTRLYVHDDVYDEFVAKVPSIVGSLAVGDPLDPGVLIGPVVTEPALRSDPRRHRTSAALTARALLSGGQRLGGELATGWFVAPTLFGDVDHDSDLARHEVFGPVLAMLRFSDEDEVVAQGERQSPSGSPRTSTPVTRRGSTASLDALEAGTVTVNGFPAMSPSAPFGGYKQSGFGREGGRAGIEEIVRRKSVYIAP